MALDSIRVICDNCAYYMNDYTCGNPKSPHYKEIMEFLDRCVEGTGRESDGFVTRLRKEK